YWSRREGICNSLHIHLKPEMIRQTAEASEMDIKRISLVECFSKQDLQLHHQYVIQQRVEQAKLMLSKTDLAIADIASKVGFSSQSHLTQQFKRLTGMTPKQVHASP
ncbi:MAG: helix-turn-helix transcriptional regulator, partial [Chroococcidiopsis sp.]